MECVFQWGVGVFGQTIPKNQGISLSIISVTYGDPFGLQKTLRSLEALNDTNLSWEHVIVDSSPLANRSLIKKLRANAWPLHYQEQAPRGIYPAMNLGIDAARGKYLWFLNGGDQLRSPKALIKLIDFLDKHPIFQLACAAADLMREDQYCFTSYPLRSFRKSLLKGRSLCHQAMIYRREIFLALGPYGEDFTHAGDEEFHLRVYGSGAEVACLPERITLFDNQGTSYRNFTHRYRELNEVRKTRARHSLGLWEYGYYSLHFFRNFLRGKLFIYLRDLPFYERLRGPWLIWRRFSVRYG